MTQHGSKSLPRRVLSLILIGLAACFTCIFIWLAVVYVHDLPGVNGPEKVLETSVPLKWGKLPNDLAPRDWYELSGAILH